MKLGLLTLVILWFAACGERSLPKVVLDFEPLPFPQAPRLRLMGQINQLDAAQPNRIVDALINAENQVFVATPQIGVFRFDDPNWNSSALPLPRDLKIADLTQLGLGAEGLVIGFGGAQKAALVRAAGVEVIELASPETQVSRDGFLLFPQKGGQIWSRCGLDGTRIVDYALQGKGMPLLTCANQAGSFAALGRDLVLESFDGDGKALGALVLPANGKGGQILTYTALDLRAGMFYLTYLCGGQKNAFVLVIDAKGTVRQNWAMPVAADGISVNATNLLIFEKAQGNAYTFPLPEN